MYTLVKSCITNEDSTYTRQVIRYERGPQAHSSSHALRTRTPYVYTRQVIHHERGLHMYTLVKSFVTNKDSTYTRQVMDYERGLHMYILVKSYITNEVSPYTGQVMPYERGLHIHSSGHALRMQMAHLLSCRQLDDACTADDLATVTERAKACTRKWEKIV